MTLSAKTRAEKIIEYIAMLKNIGITDFREFIAAQISEAEREAWEGGHKAGTKFLENVEEYHKKAREEGFHAAQEKAAESAAWSAARSGSGSGSI